MSLTPEQRMKVEQLLVALNFLPDPAAVGSQRAGAGSDTSPTPSLSDPAAFPTYGAIQIADARFQDKMEGRT